MSGVASNRIYNGDVSTDLRPQLSLTGLSATSTFALQRHGEYHYANTYGSPRISTNDINVFRVRNVVGRSQRRQPPGDLLALQEPAKGKQMHASSKAADASKTSTRLSLHLIFEFDGIAIGAGITLAAGIATIIGVLTQLI
jgi:hypothetical protein